MFLSDKFISHCKQNRFFSEKDRLLIAVSGGLDSVVLTDLCCRAGFDVVLLHCNFQLRGEESEGDEAFVKQLAVKYSRELYIKKFDVEKEQKSTGGSVQEAARKLRYEWFQEQAQTFHQNFSGKVYILTAHHADDQIETLLHHFFRGTGIKGLTGIPESVGNLRRPLLSFFREELEQYAAEEKLEFRTDSSNTATKYTRNFIRLQVLPLLEQIYPTIRSNLHSSVQRFQSIDAVYREGVEMIRKKVIIRKGNQWELSIRLLNHYKEPALWYELLHPFGFTEKQLPDLMHLTTSDSGRMVLAADGPHRLIRHRQRLILSALPSADTSIYILDSSAQQQDFPAGIISWQMVKSEGLNISRNPFDAYLDAKEIRFPMILRKWKQGDYFYPLGMRKKKKIARFLIDQRIPLNEKEQVWVLESDERILWVVGMRPDDRFKVTDKTSQVLKMELRVH